MSEVLLRIEGLGVRYPKAQKPALSDVNLEVGRGERLAVVGESGSGKSTLALALAGLLPRGSVSGNITWPGLSAPPVAGRDIGVVFQDPGNSLNPVLRVGEQIAEVLVRHVGLSWPEAWRRAEELVGQVGLPDPARTARAFPHQLSGGQRQRIGIAEALAAGPALLIADEATSALDTIVQAEILALLDRLVRERHSTLILITHDIALASQFADRIAVFHDGRLVETGSAEAVTTRPSDAYTANLLASQIDLTTPPLIGEAL
ncbi:MAG TPA: ABC transporter ATP-binding protein [Devosia sp.]|nr:ABC transporter ATP-binding protein [Devosia sp.]